MILYAGICIFRYFCALERSLIHISRYFSYKTRNTGCPKYEIFNTRLYRNRFDPGLIMVYEGSSLIVSYANFYSISSEFINIEYIIYWYKLCVTYSVRVYPHQGAIPNNQLRFFQFTRLIKCKVLVVGQPKITDFYSRLLSPLWALSHQWTTITISVIMNIILTIIMFTIHRTKDPHLVNKKLFDEKADIVKILFRRDCNGARKR